ncbi:hypothetical protein FKP32DRAFT_1392712 [Trametes sanguinea]|nr:hypothetical protein FKP32DRAFT_1392712 [Trametes sanguinea]
MKPYRRTRPCGPLLQYPGRGRSHVLLAAVARHFDHGESQILPGRNAGRGGHLRATHDVSRPRSRAPAGLDPPSPPSGPQGAPCEPSWLASQVEMTRRRVTSALAHRVLAIRQLCLVHHSHPVYVRGAQAQWPKGTRTILRAVVRKNMRCARAPSWSKDGYRCQLVSGKLSTAPRLTWRELEALCLQDALAQHQVRLRTRTRRIQNYRIAHPTSRVDYS